MANNILTEEELNEDLESEEHLNLNKQIKNILHTSNLSFDETKGFFDGLQYLPMNQKKQFIEMINEDIDLIYPLYINFKAKLKSLEEDTSGRSFEEIVEDEVKALENYIEKDNESDIDNEYENAENYKFCRW